MYIVDAHLIARGIEVAEPLSRRYDHLPTSVFDHTLDSVLYLSRVYKHHIFQGFFLVKGEIDRE